MKLISIVFLLFYSFSAFASSSEKLCLQKGQSNLSRFYKNGIFKEKLVSAQIAEYNVGENMDGEVVVQYEYNTQTDQGSKYARVLMLKKGCQFMAADSHNSKQDMESDDLDAAQGGASY
jgi:hypothetical protein